MSDLFSASVCNLPFPIIDPDIPCAKIPYRASSTQWKDRKGKEKTVLYIYTAHRQLCFTEFRHAAAKWYPHFLLLTYDDSSFPCHLSQCRLISRHLKRRQFQLRDASRVSEVYLYRSYKYACIRVLSFLSSPLQSNKSFSLVCFNVNDTAISFRIH